MEVPTIVEALKATTQMGSQKDALTYLDEASKMIGFLPLLSDISGNSEIEIPVRQAAIIFFKNGIQRGWVVDEEDEKDATPVSEQDKNVIRGKIVSQIVCAPQPIRVHLATALQNILRCDYPEKWPDFPHAVAALLHVEDANTWLAAFNITHRLTKVYEYRRQQEKQPMYDFMSTVLPLIYARFETLVATGTEESAVLEHYILKIFYCLTQFSMNTDLISIETFGRWIGLLVRILERPIPPNVAERDEEDQSETFSWKCKKWAMKIITKIFDRYGAKGQVEKTYLPYADYYFEHFALPVVNCVLHILKDYSSKKFVTERYVFFALSHLADALGHAEIWKVVKPHFNDLVLHVIFPSLCYTDEDEELWETEELDFIRQRHDYFDELHSPSAAAANVLQAGLKRKGVLEEMLQHFINVLNDGNSPVRQVDGALHVLANLMPKLATSRKFKKDVEKLVHMHIIPRLRHENKFIRLHAAYCMKMCDQVSFKHDNILKESIEGLMGQIGNPDELLAIKVEAGIAINSILDEQGEKCSKYIRPHVRSLLTELFRLLTQTSLDELTTITDSIIETFPEEVIPVAVEVATEIHNLFIKYANQNNDETSAEGEDGEDEEDKTITMIGLLTTLQTLLDLVDDNPEISSKLEPVVFNIVHTIYTSDAFDFFEDAVSLVESVIVKHVSDKAWEFYPMIRQKFDISGPSQYPTLNDYMNCLHSYLTVDTEKFLSVPERSVWMLEMCEATLKNFDLDAEAHVHAAKLLECFILQCPGRVNDFIPNILQVTMNRLQAGHFEETNNELVPQLLVVLIAAMHYNFELFVQCLNHLQPFGMETVQWLFSEIFANKEHIEGVHNRKMVLYAICLMLRLPHEHQPPAIANDAKAVATFCLELFDGIDKCLKAIAERKKEELESSDDDDDDSETDDEHPNRTIDDELRDSDDDIDEGTLEYLEHLNKEEKKESRKRGGPALNGNANGDAAAGDGFRSDSDDSEGFHMFQEETDIESYVTPVDDEEHGLNVYIEFKKALETLQGNSPAQFAQLTQLQGEEAESLKSLFELCVQQENLVKSLALKKSGGCTFDAQAKVPSSFDFS
jgi:hypothetical protein